MLLQIEDTKNLAGLTKLSLCEKKMFDPRLTHFAYRVEDIIKEIKKRTNYIGSTRVTKEGKTLVDTITYTNDEFDLDIPLTRDAMANVFMPLLEFADGVGESYLYGEHSHTHHVELNHGFTFETRHTLSSNSSSIGLELISDKALDSEHYASVVLDVEYEVTDIFGGVTQKALKHEVVISRANTPMQLVGDKYVFAVTIAPEYEADTTDNGLGGEKVEVTRVKNVIARAMEYNPTRIHRGEWIEIVNNGVTELYVCHTQCTSNNKFGCPNYYTFMPFDFRHTIHYILWFPELRNHGALHALDTHIENALITYCIYRWFLKVYPDEADRWYAEFERRMELIKELLDSVRGAYGERPMWYC